MCYDEGMLQAYIDNELSARERKNIEIHLADCLVCRQLLQALQENNYFCTARLTNYNENIDNQNQVTKLPVFRSEDLEKSFIDFGGKKREENKHKGVFTIMNRYKKVAAGVAATLVLAGSLAFAPVRAKANDLLDLFRADKIQAVQIKPDDLNRVSQVFSKNKESFKIENLGEFSNNVDKQPVRSVTMEQAKKLAEFKINGPTYLPAEIKEAQYSSTNYEAPMDVNFKLNVQNVNGIIKYLGSKKLLPTSLSGKQFSMHISSVVNMNWQSDSGKKPVFLNITQALSPELRVPGGVNPEQIRDAILSLNIIPQNIREQLASIDDWQHTLPVPVVEGKSREVTVNGTPAIYVAGNGQHSTLIYNKDGVVTVMSGNISFDEMVKIAESMR